MIDYPQLAVSARVALVSESLTSQRARSLTQRPNPESTTEMRRRSLTVYPPRVLSQHWSEPVIQDRFKEYLTCMREIESRPRVEAGGYMQRSSQDLLNCLSIRTNDMCRTGFIQCHFIYTFSHLHVCIFPRGMADGCTWRHPLYRQWLFQAPAFHRCTRCSPRLSAVLADSTITLNDTTEVESRYGADGHSLNNPAA